MTVAALIIPPRRTLAKPPRMPPIFAVIPNPVNRDTLLVENGRRVLLGKVVRKASGTLERAVGLLKMYAVQSGIEAREKRTNFLIRL